MKKKDITTGEIIKNNAYAVKLLWGISPRRVICMAMLPFISYFSWMFYSTYFIRYVVAAIENNAPFSQIFSYIAIVCAVTAILQLFAAFASNVTIPLDDVKVYSQLYQKLYKKAENVELACFEDSEFYNKYTMALDDACGRVTEIVALIFNIIAALAAGIFTYVAMYSIDKMMLVFIVAPLIGNFLFGSLLNKLNYRMYKDMTPDTRRIDYVNRVMYLAEYAKEMRVSRIFNVLMRDYGQSTKNKIATVKKYGGKTVRHSFFSFYFSYPIIFEGILLYGAYCALVSKTMTAGELAVLTSMMVVGSWILIGFANDFMECGKNGIFMNNIRTFMNYQETIPEDQGGASPDEKMASIEFRNVSFAYQEDEPVIENLSFKISAGKSVALVGHNGAGKTTIIKLLMRLYDPTEGEIIVNGKNIKEYNLKEYRRLFAVAFQDYRIFAATVKKNVLAGRDCNAPAPAPDAAVQTALAPAPDVAVQTALALTPDVAVQTALERAGIYEKIMSYPSGIDTVLTKEFDEDGAVLSGGELQKIVVARAFANPAPVKIFDEPSSALDPIAEHDLFENIIEESKGCTMIFISHRLSSVKNADEVLMLESGRIIERGTHTDLMENACKYADMYQKQAENYQNF